MKQPRIDQLHGEEEINQSSVVDSASSSDIPQDYEIEFFSSEERDQYTDNDVDISEENLLESQLFYVLLFQLFLDISVIIWI